MVASTIVSFELSFVMDKSLIQVLGSDNELDGLLGADELVDDVFREMEEGEDSNQSLGPPLKPERVLVFTTLNLLSMLTIASIVHVDGTFKVNSFQHLKHEVIFILKVMCKHWKQLFVLIADVRGVPIVLALGFLPDKKEVLISPNPFLFICTS